EREVISRHEITIDRILNDLEDAFELADAQGNPSAMIAATMAQAKLCGLITDRKEIKRADPVDSMDREQLFAVLRDHLGENAEIVLTVLGLIPSPNVTDAAN